MARPILLLFLQVTLHIAFWNTCEVTSLKDRVHQWKRGRRRNRGWRRKDIDRIMDDIEKMKVNIAAQDEFLYGRKYAIIGFGFGLTSDGQKSGTFYGYMDLPQCLTACYAQRTTVDHSTNGVVFYPSNQQCNCEKGTRAHQNDQSSLHFTLHDLPGAQPAPTPSTNNQTNNGFIGSSQPIACCNPANPNGNLLASVFDRLNRYVETRNYNETQQRGAGTQLRSKIKKRRKRRKRLRHIKM